MRNSTFCTKNKKESKIIMKLVSISFFCIIWTIGCSKPKNQESLIDRDGVMYMVNEQKPYSGPVFSLYQQGKGQKYSEGSFLNGRKEGVWTYWKKNGQKNEEGTFKEGAKNGKWTYWGENNVKYAEGTYKDDIKDGLWTYWKNENSKLAEGRHKNGNKVGDWSYWLESGQEKKIFMTSSSEIKSLFSLLRAKYRANYQMYGDTSDIDINMFLKDTYINQKTNLEWKFEVFGNPPIKFTAITTDKFSGGEGNKIWFDVNEAKYSTHEIDVLIIEKSISD